MLELRVKYNNKIIEGKWNQIFYYAKEKGKKKIYIDGNEIIFSTELQDQIDTLLVMNSVSITNPPYNSVLDLDLKLNRLESELKRKKMSDMLKKL